MSASATLWSCRPDGRRLGARGICERAAERSRNAKVVSARHADVGRTGGRERWGAWRRGCPRAAADLRTSSRVADCGAGVCSDGSGAEYAVWYSDAYSAPVYGEQRCTAFSGRGVGFQRALRVSVVQVRSELGEC